MKKINKSTGIMLAMAMLFFSLAALTLPLLEGSLKRQLCVKLDTFVSTWIEVAGAFAFSQGRINVAELAFLQKNDQILDNEVGKVDQMPEIVFGSEPEMALADARAAEHHLIHTNSATCSAKSAFITSKVIVRSKVNCDGLPVGTFAMADMLKCDPLAREDFFKFFSEERTQYIFRRAEEMNVAKAFENVRVYVARRAAAMRPQLPAQPKLRTVILNESKRRLCPSENSDIITGPETSF